MAALAGYSAGGAPAARGRAVPRLADLLLAFGYAAAAAVVAPRLGWGGGAALGVGGGLGAGRVRPPRAAPRRRAADRRGGRAALRLEALRAADGELPGAAAAGGELLR